MCAELLRTGDLYLRWFVNAAAATESWSARAVRDHAAEHRAILDAVLARDPKLATQRYEDHLRFTGSWILGTEAPTMDIHISS